jgi:hypothetical protein
MRMSKVRDSVLDVCVTLTFGEHVGNVPLHAVRVVLLPHAAHTRALYVLETPCSRKIEG